MFQRFERAEDEKSDYVVGWIDAFGRGTGLGRGQVHVARYLAPGEDPEARETLALDRQDLPPRMFGVLPKRWLWRFMRPLANRLGMRALNWGRYHWLRVRPAAATRLEEHARFNFLLDYVPDWKRMYGKNGLIQYQFFLPKDDAEEVFRRALEMCQAAGLEPWLVVMKRHRQDAFWLSHALDGYSFACDFPVLPTRRGDLWRLTQRFNRVVTAAGGRFYFAKDSVLTGDAVERAFGPAVLGRFFALKERLDPQGTLQSSLFRRVFGARWRALAAGAAAVDASVSEEVVGAPPEA